VGIEHRIEDRVFVALPVTLEGSKGVTRDVSATGVYFECDVDCAAGSDIAFSLEFEDLGFPLLVWNCKGMVVRIEKKNGKTGIAARITEFEWFTSSKTGEEALSLH
jgi:hypothetical protein